MKVGDVSFHSGWLLHSAGPQPRGTAPRLALAVSYFADGARLLDARGDASLRCAAACRGMAPRRAAASCHASHWRDMRPRRIPPSTHNTQTPSLHAHTPRRRENLHDEDAEGHSEWLPDLRGGAPARHALLPLVWPPQQRRRQ